MRGVTLYISQLFHNFFISTHTPHARRDVVGALIVIISMISTHTPHARRDGAVTCVESTLMEFLLTRLMRGVTCGFVFI